VPVHIAPKVVMESGLAGGGWIPVDKATLQTRFAGAYAIGDVTSVGTPRAGTSADGAGRVEQAVRRHSEEPLVRAVGLSRRKAR
jgi:sulfide:quinone oxidoreductase